jgi:hypothetical protein
MKLSAIRYFQDAGNKPVTIIFEFRDPDSVVPCVETFEIESSPSSVAEKLDALANQIRGI